MSPALVVRPSDPLDLPEAQRLVAELEALPSGVRVHVDLGGVREVHPAALAFLAYALDPGGPVTMGGMSRRQERLIAYLLGNARTVEHPTATPTSTVTPTATPAATA